MKALNITLVFLLFTFFTSAQIEMNSSGEVGIGTAPQSGLTLDIDGKVTVKSSTNSNDDGFDFTSTVISSVDWHSALVGDSHNNGVVGTAGNRYYQVNSFAVNAQHFNTESDLRIKENIKGISGALESVLLMNPVKYDIKRSYFESSGNNAIDKLHDESKNTFGVIAQEMENIYPNLVNYQEEIDLYSVNYVELIPVLIAALQDQNAIVDSLGQEINNLKNALTDIALHNIEDNATETEIREDAIQIKGAKLFQNIPNPATESTTINFDLPENIKSAAISVYNVNGKLVESISLGQNKSGSVVMQAGDLKPGIYVYSLVADGTLVDSKQMVITE